MAKKHLLDLQGAEWEDFTADLGEPGYRAGQIRDWIFGRLESDFRRMSNLPRKFIENLEEKAAVAVLKERSRQDSADGTRKWALETQDGQVFETVLIPTENRRSLCVSTQIGCAMGCTF